MKSSTLLIIAILVIAVIAIASVAVYEYQNKSIPEPVAEVVKLPVEPIVKDVIPLIVKEDIPLIEDDPIQNDTLHKGPLPLTNDDYDVMVQKHYAFSNQYQSLVLIHGNVLSNPIDYGYVYEEGFPDKDLGVAYCTTLSNHIVNISSLHRGLNYSLGQLVLIEDKSPDTILLIEEQYKVLSGLMFKEVSLLKYNFYTFECDIILDDKLDIDNAEVAP